MVDRDIGHPGRTRRLKPAVGRWLYLARLLIVGWCALNVFDFGDEVTVAMPRGVSKRGIPGISVLYSTWPEARFDGATGTVIGIDPRSTYGIPLYLVDFSQHKNRVAIPWQRQWFRGEWIVPAGDRTPKPVATEGALVAASGAGETTLNEST
jgi:ribosomal protein L21E